MNQIYLDNSATTRPLQHVIDAMGHIAREYYGNPSSMHKKGMEAEKILKEARKTIADCLAVDSKNILFTSGGTEANNLAIYGYLEANPRKGKHIITSKIEHASVMEACKHLADKGYRVDFIGVDNAGKVRLEELEKAIGPDTALISIMCVNNETGAIQPFEQIAKIRDARNKQTVFHMDSVQAFGKIPIRPLSAGVDLVSASSHKIYGPKGVGFLYAASSVRLSALLWGGGQENGVRSGTENVPGIHGFSISAEYACKAMEQNRYKVAILRQRLLQKLTEKIPQTVIVSPEDGLSHILNVAFPGVKSQVLLQHLEEKGVYVSNGSACSSRKSKLSHVLTAMALPRESIEGAIRFSFCPENTEEEVLEAANIVAQILPMIQIRKQRGGKI